MDFELIGFVFPWPVTPHLVRSRISVRTPVVMTGAVEVNQFGLSQTDFVDAASVSIRNSRQESPENAAAEGPMKCR